VTALWLFIVALVGGAVGGTAVFAIHYVFYGRLDSVTTRQPRDGAEGEMVDDLAKQLELIRDDLWKARDISSRVLEELSPLSGKLDALAAGAILHVRGEKVGLQTQRPDALREDLAPYPGTSGPLRPSAMPSAPTLPPPNAINVEAREDRLVASPSYPPEAWLEPQGPASGRLWLNPQVALTENALRRLSAFFSWETESPGCAYETREPAVVHWDDARRTGSVTTRGTARPL
jgi:hypothetical protein